MSIQLPYGLWKGVISPETVAKRARINTLHWGEGGKALLFTTQSGLYRKRAGQPLVRIPMDQPVFGSVGYGGGDFAARNDTVVFCSGSAGLFRLNRDSAAPIALTNDRFERCSPVISPDGKAVAYITSDGEHDQIALLDLQGYAWPRLWIQGADFYMQPEWSRDGRYFAWVEWDHPQMPWTGSRVMLAKLDPEKKIISETLCVAGREGCPASQPHFSPDNRRLAFITAAGEWESICSYDLTGGETRGLIIGDGWNLSEPAFSQGNNSYGWFADSKRMAYTRIAGTVSEVWVKNFETGTDSRISPSRLTTFEQVRPADDGRVAAVAAGPLDFAQVILMDGKGSYEVIYRVNDMKLDASFVSVPQELTWKSRDGQPVHALYYSPCNPNCSWHGLPPAIVQIHGGPTGKADRSFSPETAYFCSLGYAYVRLNYRGSSGYGRSYLNALNGHWGEIDTEDAVSLARCLSREKLADPRRLFITGGSSGGFTVLNVLTQYPEVYKCGASLYGVSDLFGLCASTWKLELHYTETLVGRLPEAEQKYFDWSPLYHAEDIRAPLLIFQGDRDNVVPPEQSESIVARLKVPHVFKMYEGEGHGFRKPEHIRDYLETMCRFMKQYL